MITAGLVEDTQVSGGLQLTGPSAVARRVNASGPTAIWGEGLVVDTLARAIGSGGAAIAADAPRGGTLRVINATAVATSAPALAARQVRSDMAPVTDNVLRVSDSIARGAPSDLQAPALLACSLGQACAAGLIEIDHSNYVVRDPEAGVRGGGAIVEGPGNQAADPRFRNRGGGDFHLLAGSPAIDAGVAQPQALALDLDGRARVQGGAVDLGAYETPGQDAGGQPATGLSGTPRQADTTAPVLGRLRLLHARFRVGAARTAVAAGAGRVPPGTSVSTTTSEAGRIRFVVRRRVAGRHGTRWVARGAALIRRAASPGRVTLVFSGRIGARRLTPGRYRFDVTATDAAGNRSAVRRVAFTVVRGRR